MDEQQADCNVALPMLLETLGTLETLGPHCATGDSKAHRPTHTCATGPKAHTCHHIALPKQVTKLYHTAK